MKKQAALAAVCALALAALWATPSFASGIRVQAMGGINLGVMDESTEINLFNALNPAGLGMLEKKNRIDEAINYSSLTIEQDSDNYTNARATGLLVSTKSDPWVTLSSFQNNSIISPFNNYQGLIYWLDQNLVINPKLMLDFGGADITTAGNSNTSSLFGFGGGIDAAYLVNPSTAVGLSVGYSSNTTKPDELGAGVSKDESTLSNLPLNFGAGMVMPDMLGAKQDLVLGLSVNTLDGSTDVDLIEYDNGNSSKETESVNPLNISIQALTAGEMIQGGLVFDYASSEGRTKSEVTGVDTLDYKDASTSGIVLSPIVKAAFKISEDVSLNPGASLSLINTSTDQFNPDYKEGKEAESQINFAVGAALELMKKALIFGAQFENIGTSTETTVYNMNGDVVGNVVKVSGAGNIISFGAEYCLMEMLALRAGYVMASDQPDTDADTKNLTNSICLGAGLKMDKLSADLLVQLDTYTEDPEPTNAPDTTGLTIALGAKMEI